MKRVRRPAKREGLELVQGKRVRTALSLGLAALCVAAFAAPALAAPAAKPRQATATTNAVLATLTIRTPNVDIKSKKKTTFAKGASGQVLRAGRHAPHRRHRGARRDLLHRRLLHAPRSEHRVLDHQAQREAGRPPDARDAHGRFHLEPRGQGRGDRVVRGQGRRSHRGRRRHALLGRVHRGDLMSVHRPVRPSARDDGRHPGPTRLGEDRHLGAGPAHERREPHPRRPPREPLGGGEHLPRQRARVRRAHRPPARDRPAG